MSSSLPFYIPNHGNWVKGDYQIMSIYSECPIRVLKTYKPTWIRRFLIRMGFKNIRITGIKVQEVKY